MTEVLTFDQALAAATDTSKRHVLLGNGFSLACRNDIFDYSALFDRAQFDDSSPLLRDAFSALDSTNFEVVMQALQKASKLAAVYAPDNPELAEQMSSDAEALKEILVQTIAMNHPERPRDITDDEYGTCRRFLSNFKTYYTINYDLLLYWTLMHEEIPPELEFSDGFRQAEEEDDYVIWGDGQNHGQNIHYLHGALHLFDAGNFIMKFTWSRTEVALIEQIRGALSMNRFPLFVSEGTAEEKMGKIHHSGYLHKALRSLLEKRDALYVYGLSFAGNDDHILKTIVNGNISQLFVGVYGDLDQPDNQRIITRAQQMVAEREARLEGTRSRNFLRLAFYDAATASVWR